MRIIVPMIQETQKCVVRSRYSLYGIIVHENELRRDIVYHHYNTDDERISMG